MSATKSEPLTYAKGDYVRLTRETIALGWPAIGQVVTVSPAETAQYVLEFSTGERLRVHLAQIAGRADKGDVTPFKTRS